MLRNVFNDNLQYFKNKSTNYLNNNLLLNTDNTEILKGDTYFKYPSNTLEVNNSINDYIGLINRTGYYTYDSSGIINLKPSVKNITENQLLRNNLCKATSGKKVITPKPITKLETFSNYKQNTINISINNLIIIVLISIFIFIIQKYKLLNY